MVVVDTNILAYLFIDGDRTAAAQALYARDPDWRTDYFALIEFTNVLATTVRTGRLANAAARHVLHEAEERMAGALYLSAHEDALGMASQYGVSGYDARFLVVAKALDARLVTEDAKLRNAAPALTVSIAEALR